MLLSHKLLLSFLIIIIKVPLYAQQFFWYSLSAVKLPLHLSPARWHTRGPHLQKVQSVTGIDASCHSPDL